MKKGKSRELNQRRNEAVDRSQNGTLPSMFFKEVDSNRPNGISTEAWRLVQKAEALIVHFEIQDLELLILDYLDAVKRAEGCKCFQCRKRARIITELLDEEIERLQFDLTKANQDQRVERQIVEADTQKAIQKMKKKKQKEMSAQFERREREWLKRSKRIRQLISKVVRHNSESEDALTHDERAEVSQLLAEARERRKDWVWKNW